MKIPIIFLTLSLATKPFGFFELNGPYGIKKQIKQKMVNEMTKQLNHPIQPLDLNLIEVDNNQGISNNYRYLCMYNSQTGYSIGFITPKFKKDNLQVWRFFKGLNSFENFDLNKKGFVTYYKGVEMPIGGWDSDYTKLKFYFVKEETNQELKDSLQPLKGCGLNKLRKNGEQLSFITLNPTIKLSNEVSIINESDHSITNEKDAAYITKGGKKVNFQDALSKYLSQCITQDNKPNQNYINDFSTKIGSGSRIESSLLAQNVYQLKKAANYLSSGIKVDQSQIDLLDKSTILAVYGVFKGEDGKDSIIWGLAKYKDNPDRRFHWITKLGDDASVLLKAI